VCRRSRSSARRRSDLKAELDLTTLVPEVRLTQGIFQLIGTGVALLSGPAGAIMLRGSGQPACASLEEVPDRGKDVLRDFQGITEESWFAHRPDGTLRVNSSNQFWIRVISVTLSA
jgi:hypothetical protein